MKTFTLNDMRIDNFVVENLKMIETVDAVTEEPRMKLGPLNYDGTDHQCVTPEFRKEFDAWLLERFGTVKKPGAFKLGDNVMVVHPEIMRALTTHFAKRIDQLWENKIMDAIYGRVP